MYSNKGKRDILIFPNFDNIDKIQAIRKKYDSLADLILPHITLVFPFSDEISDVELFEKLSCLLKNFSPFEVSFSGVSLSDDNYIFLNCIQGSDSIVKLHDEIYDKIFPSHFNKSRVYVPHITLGQACDISDFKDFKDVFRTCIDTICVELIGENEESIVLKSIKLG